MNDGCKTLTFSAGGIHQNSIGTSTSEERYFNSMTTLSTVSHILTLDAPV